MLPKCSYKWSMNPVPGIMDWNSMTLYSQVSLLDLEIFKGAIFIFKFTI